MRKPHDCFRCAKPIKLETEHWVRIVQFYLHWECYLLDRNDHKWHFYAIDKDLKPDEEHTPKE